MPLFLNLINCLELTGISECEMYVPLILLEKD